MPCHDHLPRPGRGPHRARAHRPARPRAARRRRRSRSSPARSPRPTALDRPYLVFLQGGPGFEATRPTSPPTGWMKRALKDYRVLLLDQRGTGRSTPVGATSRATRPRPRPTYLTHFRADSIVRDAELIRQELGVDRWSVLGQSFGGFTTMTYLSIAPEGLREAFITGGLSPIGRPVDDVYARDVPAPDRAEPALLRALPGRPRTGPRHPPPARRRGRPAADRRPTDRAPLPPARPVARRQRGLRAAPPRRRAAVRLAGVPRTTSRTASQFEPRTRSTRRSTSRRTPTACATRWSAERLLPDEIEAEGYFTAEHVFPWMWEDYAGLRAQREAADDPGRAPLAAPVRRRPAARTTRSRSRRRSTSTTCTSSATSPRRRRRRSAGLRTWETDEFEHNGLRADGERVLGRLIDLVRGRA